MTTTIQVDGGTVPPVRARRLFRPAVLCGPGSLSPADRAAIRAVSGPRPGRFTIELAINWAWIAAIMAVGVLADQGAVTLLCIVLVGVRQVVFGLLMHEQVHRLGWRGKYGDWWVNLLAVYPLFATTVEAYARVHLSHHRHFMTGADPDFIRKSGADWMLPLGVRRWMGLLARDLTGLNTLRLIRGKAGTGIQAFDRPHPSPRWLRVAFYAASAAALTAVQGWTVFLVYWVVPLLSVTQVGVRWIALIEHEYNVEGATVREVTPLVLPTWWQRVLFPDLNFSMHVYHHLHPGVSFSQLPKLHRIYQRAGQLDETAIFRGQGAFVAFLLGRGGP